MAITPLDLRFGLTLDEIVAVASAANLTNQAWTEVYQCWDMAQIWQDWITESFGEVVEVRHRSGNDDPPDLELVFPNNRFVGMEHTRLQPPHLGQASALLRESGRGGFVPPIWPPPADFNEIRDIISGVKDSWSDVIDEWKAISYLLAITLQRKMRAVAKGGIIAMVHDLFMGCSDHQLLGDVARNIVDRPEFADFAKYSLIILNRLNHRQFYSLLVRRGQISQFREGS